jgi:imidazolonepropionase-like amidohydrolase
MLANLLVGCVLASTAAPQDARALAIRADKVLLDDGRVIDGGIVVMHNGLIRAVGADADVPSDAARLEHKGWLSAGLIALHSYSGTTADLYDSTRASLPEARLGWAIDPSHPEMADLLREGITSVVLTPSRRGLVGGVGAVVKCSGGEFVSREAQLTLGFSGDSLLPNRAPTSHAGAVAELDRLFEKPSGLIEKAARGDVRVMLEVSTRADVARAIDFAQRHKLSASLSGAALIGEMADEVKRSGFSVVCKSIGVGEELRSLRAIVALAAAEVPFGFGLDAPWRNAAELRLGAALCMREGLARQAAWRALTAEAARIAGVEERIGSLAEGRDADIVLWSGDPLALGSGVVSVFVGGKRVFEAEQR